ncbi:MAG: Pimeloyl-ACP methyl ester carboxylesterase [Frankiales bacterium]|nr:Pimeloyl-ACP methyl ester carboxylesterase [Frankiales bacterium]
MSRRRQAGVIGAIAGAVAVGAAAGLAAERYAIGRTRLAPDPDAREPYFRLPADRIRTVTADDGVPLHVEEVGPAGAPLTLVFCHGYTNQLAVWHFQRKALADEKLGKLVFWDQRSHGKSGRSSAKNATIDQLGRDLLAVVEATAPSGRVILVGHSMGGMTIMALAYQHPELFGDRVVGVALIATSTGKMAEVTCGLPAFFSGITKRALPFVTRGMIGQPRLVERGRRIGTDLAFVATKRAAFGSSDVSPSLVEFVEAMTAAMPVDVIAEFFETFVDHDKLAALPALRGIEVLILAGSEDVITPVDHSRTMAAELPSAQLVVVEGAGHMLQLERAAMVTLHLRALVSRATRSASRTA